MGLRAASSGSSTVSQASSQRIPHAPTGMPSQGFRRPPSAARPVSAVCRLSSADELRLEEEEEDYADDFEGTEEETEDVMAIADKELGKEALGHHDLRADAMALGHFVHEAEAATHRADEVSAEEIPPLSVQAETGISKPDFTVAYRDFPHPSEKEADQVTKEIETIWESLPKNEFDRISVEELEKVLIGLPAAQHSREETAAATTIQAAARAKRGRNEARDKHREQCGRKTIDLRAEIRAKVQERAEVEVETGGVSDLDLSDITELETPIQGKIEGRAQTSVVTGITTPKVTTAEKRPAEKKSIRFAAVAPKSDYEEAVIEIQRQVRGFLDRRRIQTTIEIKRKEKAIALQEAELTAQRIKVRLITAKEQLIASLQAAGVYPLGVGHKLSVALDVMRKHDRAGGTLPEEAFMVALEMNGVDPTIDAMVQLRRACSQGTLVHFEHFVRIWHSACEDVFGSWLERPPTPPPMDEALVLAEIKAEIRAELARHMSRRSHASRAKLAHAEAAAANEARLEAEKAAAVQRAELERQERYRRRREEEDAALKIQAVSRGRSGRLKYRRKQEQRDSDRMNLSQTVAFTGEVSPTTMDVKEEIRRKMLERAIQKQTRLDSIQEEQHAEEGGDFAHLTAAQKAEAEVLVEVLEEVKEGFVDRLEHHEGDGVVGTYEMVEGEDGEEVKLYVEGVINGSNTEALGTGTNNHKNFKPKRIKANHDGWDKIKKRVSSDKVSQNTSPSPRPLTPILTLIEWEGLKMDERGSKRAKR